MISKNSEVMILFVKVLILDWRPCIYSNISKSSSNKFAKNSFLSFSPSCRTRNNIARERKREGSLKILLFGKKQCKGASATPFRIFPLNPTTLFYPEFEIMRGKRETALHVLREEWKGDGNNNVEQKCKNTPSI